MIYRFVDEYVEELSAKTIEDNEENVCVQVSGKILSDNIQAVLSEFSGEEPVIQEEDVKKVVEEVRQEVNIKPTNPENLSLVYIKGLEYFNGAKSVKYANLLKKHVEVQQYELYTTLSPYMDSKNGQGVKHWLDT
jgi:hemerythrin-like domain-containing protein